MCNNLTYPVPKILNHKQEGNFDAEKYSNLLAKLRAVFDPHGYRLTVALHPWQKLVPTGYAAVHGVHLMAYDLGRERHSTMQLAKQAVGMQIQAKAPKEKIILGIPAYGRGIGNPGRVATYSEVRAFKLYISGILLVMLDQRA